MPGKNVAEIHLPGLATNSLVGMDRAQIEQMVQSILGGQAGRGVDAVVIKGGQDAGGRGAAADWSKTIWSRDC